MDFRYYLAWFALACAIAAATAYGFSLWLRDEDVGNDSRPPRVLAFARSTFFALFMTLLVTSALLMQAVITHDFGIKYVANYSDRSLPLFYLVSCFWAGQEGTFLLWAFYTGALGLIIMYTASSYERSVMFFFTLIEVFLCTMLVRINPFAASPVVPPDGVGLNPLLQNPWMVIHPPIMFLGYTAMGVPMAFALAGLLRRDWEGWVRRVMPWALFAWCALGAAVCMGGYWAYVTLGWGGYWGWDPVENASFLPWVMGTALLHGLVAQRNRKVMHRTNFVLAMLPALLVQYGTFLTRSGVLENFSVHSFVNLGLGGWLLFFMAAFSLLGAGMLVWRWREIPRGSGYASLITREAAFVAGIAILILIALFVGLGTSSPILTGLFGSASSVDISFYAVVTIPLGILLALALGIAPLMQWKKTPRQRLVSRLVGPAAAGLATPLALFPLWSKLAWYALLLAACAVFALVANLMTILQVRRVKRIGGYLAHVGVALMLLGIVWSSFLDRSKVLSLEAGKPAQAFGYAFEYHPTDKLGSTEKHKLDIIARRLADQRTFPVRPELEFSAMNQGWMKRPGIKKQWNYDIYVSPVEEIDPNSDAGVDMIFEEGETKEAGDIKITFKRFRTRADANLEHMWVGAELAVDLYGKRTETVTPAVSVADGKQTSEPASLDVDGTQVKFELNGIDATNRRAGVTLSGARTVAAPTAIVEVKINPHTNILWFGTVLTVFAVGMACWRRMGEVE